MSRQQRIVAVVVTWNRRTLLERSLRAVLAQTRAVDAVVVVDNASTDGTADLLRTDFRAVTVRRSAANLGGAGGFALGIEHALGAPGPEAADLLWLMDDDTVPEPTALAELLTARDGYPGPPPALVASRVTWTDGRDHPMNTPRRWLGAGRDQRRAASRVGCVPIRSASFVSVLVDAAGVRERGLPLADYFLWNDDFEFTTRLVRGRVALWCPDSLVVHHTQAFGAADADPGERFFYEVRNKVWLFSRSSGLSPVEKLGYGASTVARWVRTLARSGDRRLLLSCLRRGLLAGVRSGPRPTSEVLAAADARGRAADG